MWRREQALLWAGGSHAKPMGEEVCVAIWGFRRKLGDTFLLSPPTAVFPTIPPGAVRGAELLVSLSLDSDRDSVNSYHGRHHPGAMFRLTAAFILSFPGQPAAHNGVRDGYCSDSCAVVGEIEDS